MFQKDYIMRMIEQLSIAFAAIIGSKSKTQIEEYHLLVNEALYDLSGMSEDTLLKLSHQDLINIISGGKEINTEKCFALAEILMLKGDASKDDSDRGLELYLKSFNIFVEVTLNKRLNVQNRNQIINEIINLIKQYNIPKESSQLLFRYYEFTGQYDKAEDVLFKMIKIYNQAQITDEGFAFYERLKGKSLIELEEGNLPLDEVIEGLEVYRNMLKF
ncbi:hypothetical protein JCM17380_54740 [Desulfosporosinus burensis]